MKKVQIGGQAVIEGIMMRGKNAYSIVVRKPDGDLVIHKENITGLNEKYTFFKLPVLRGFIALFETLILGIKALAFSANHAMAEEVNEDAKTKDNANKNSFELGFIEIFVTIAFSLGIGFVLFFLLPLFITNLLKIYFDVLEYNFLYIFVDGILRIMIFITYIYLISQMKDIKRVFQYHGAEHKAVFNLESGEPLSIENARKFSPLHPRCGTSFLLLVMVISILVFSFIPKEISLIERALWRLILIPLISGISYELIKLSGNNSSHPFVSIIVKPGMLLQKLTTSEPTDDQLDIAIIAIKEVLSMQKENIKTNDMSV